MVPRYPQSGGAAQNVARRAVLQWLSYRNGVILGSLERAPTTEGQEMDVNRFVQFVLRGSSDSEQYAILLVRVSIGLFFAISGANKLFAAGGLKTMYETLVAAKIPFPRQMASFVSGVEFIGGFLLALGLLSTPGLRGFINRHDCRHPDEHAFRHAQGSFAAHLARRFPLPTGSSVRAPPYLAELFRSGKGQRRLLDRRCVTEVTHQLAIQAVRDGSGCFEKDCGPSLHSRVVLRKMQRCRCANRIPTQSAKIVSPDAGC